MVLLYGDLDGLIMSSARSCLTSALTKSATPIGYRYNLEYTGSPSVRIVATVFMLKGRNALGYAKAFVLCLIILLKFSLTASGMLLSSILMKFTF